MRHTPTSLLFLLLLNLSLIGCDGSSDNQPSNEAVSNPVHLETPPINLNISSEMLESLNVQDDDFLAPTETPSASLKNKKQENKLNLSGKVHIDDEEDSYIDAIDGGEVNVEIKFE
jgi:hypothetical protein